MERGKLINSLRYLSQAMVEDGPTCWFFSHMNQTLLFLIIMVYVFSVTYK